MRLEKFLEILKPVDTIVVKDYVTENSLMVIQDNQKLYTLLSDESIDNVMKRDVGEVDFDKFGNLVILVYSYEV